MLNESDPAPKDAGLKEIPRVCQRPRCDEQLEDLAALSRNHQPAESILCIDRGC